ncbi:TPA: winged helix-turn-helix domain-containing protein [Aeromonas veronii]|nr:winged helix-turn-helix domain-containing protein [Aeromonas veronii]
MLVLCVETGSVKYNSELVARLGQSETLVLSELIMHSGELLTKDKLLDIGWPNKIVAPNSLTAAIKQIRKAIKHIEHEVLIETVYRRGYILHNSANSPISIINGDPILVAEMEPLAKPIEDAAGQKTAIVAANVTATQMKATSGEVAVAAVEHPPVSEDEADVQGGSNALPSEPAAPEGASTTTEPSRHETAVLVASLSTSNETRVKRSLTLSSVKKYMIYFYFIIVVGLAYVVYVARSEISCLTIAEANVCGVFELPGYKHTRVVELIGDRTGNFYYGYNNKLESIEVHKVH